MHKKRGGEGERDNQQQEGGKGKERKMAVAPR